MLNHHRMYEIRCPVHGFIQLNDLEWTIINQPVFQRLRRIRQLAWTDYVYPGAMHTRFEHSLGVMHVASRLFDAIEQRSKGILESELAYKPDGLKRHKQLVRLAALLHDVGHGPFSHAAEELMPPSVNGDGQFTHEDYSAEIVRIILRDAIENHELNTANWEITAEQVAALLEGNTTAKQAVFWRDLIDGQTDADRMDYLLRDSAHAGVQYGRFDLERIIFTIEAIPGVKGKGPRLGFSEGGWHAAESLVLARYFMFTQLYFHHTRVAFDVHLKETLKELLPGGCFPPPTDGHLEEYLSWNDWKVLGLLEQGKGGEHGQRLSNRDHYREIYHTPETPTPEDLDKLNEVRSALGELLAAEVPAEKSWYKTGTSDIPIRSEKVQGNVEPLSAYSPVVANMSPIRQRKLFVRKEDQIKAQEKVQGGNYD